MVLVKCKKCQKVRNYTGTITDKAKIQCNHSHTPSTKECSWVDENGVTIECPFLKQGEKYRCGNRGVDIIEPQQKQETSIDSNIQSTQETTSNLPPEEKEDKQKGLKAKVLISMQKSGADLLLEEEAKRNAAEKAAKEKSTVDFYAWLRGAYNDLIEVNMLAKGNQAAKLPDEDLKEFGKLYAQVVAHEFGFTPPYYAKLLAMEARHHVQSYQLGQEVIKLRKMQEELKKQQEQIQK